MEYVLEILNSELLFEYKIEKIKELHYEEHYDFIFMYLNLLII